MFDSFFEKNADFQKDKASKSKRLRKKICSISKILQFDLAKRSDFFANRL